MENSFDILKIVSAILDVVLDNIPKVLMLVALLAAYIEYRCKKLGYDTALLALREKELGDGHSPTPETSTSQDSYAKVSDPCGTTPEQFHLWVKRRRDVYQNGGDYA